MTKGELRMLKADLAYTVDRLRELRIYAKNIELQRVYYEDRQAQLEAKISQAGEAT